MCGYIIASDVRQALALTEAPKQLFAAWRESYSARMEEQEDLEAAQRVGGIQGVGIGRQGAAGGGGAGGGDYAASADIETGLPATGSSRRAARAGGGPCLETHSMPVGAAAAADRRSYSLGGEGAGDAIERALDLAALDEGRPHIPDEAAGGVAVAPAAAAALVPSSQPSSRPPPHSSSASTSAAPSRQPSGRWSPFQIQGVASLLERISHSGFRATTPDPGPGPSATPSSQLQRRRSDLATHSMPIDGSVTYPRGHPMQLHQQSRWRLQSCPASQRGAGGNALSIQMEPLVSADTDDVPPLLAGHHRAAVAAASGGGQPPRSPRATGGMKTVGFEAQFARAAHGRGLGESLSYALPSHLLRSASRQGRDMAEAFIEHRYHCRTAEEALVSRVAGFRAGMGLGVLVECRAVVGIVAWCMNSQDPATDLMPQPHTRSHPTHSTPTTKRQLLNPDY